MAMATISLTSVGRALSNLVRDFEPKKVYHHRVGEYAKNENLREYVSVCTLSLRIRYSN
jgi:hypothetical protein